jgi:hypothetical protein
VNLLQRIFFFYKSCLSALWQAIRRQDEDISKAFSKAGPFSWSPQRSGEGAEWPRSGFPPFFEPTKPGGINLLMFNVLIWHIGTLSTCLSFLPRINDTFYRFGRMVLIGIIIVSFSRLPFLVPSSVQLVVSIIVILSNHFREFLSWYFLRPLCVSNGQ